VRELIIAAVVHTVLDKVISAAAAFGLLGATLLPSEHIHSIHAHDGHHSELVHRHYESHPAETRPVLDHGDEDITWLAVSFIKPQSPAQIVPTLHVFENPVPVLLPEPIVNRVIRTVRVSAHDPPWIPSSGLRAPPTISA
jgi:hypothetical protein